MKTPLSVRRRLLGCLLAAALLIALAGCSGGGEAPDASYRGEVVSHAQTAAYTQQQVEAALAFAGLSGFLPARYGITFHKVVYRTVDASGAPATASGLIALPAGATGALPLVSYQHGTVVERSQAPSNPNSQEAQFVGLAATSGGYVLAAADYLGLGDSTGLHPYLHAQSEATACLDMLRAARRVCTELGVTLSDQLFLAGYSQGGHATMALQRELERRHRAEFTVTASAPMAGPYDLSGTTFAATINDPSASSSYYAAYLLVAYNMLYGLYHTPSEAFVAPYDGEVAGLFDGSHSAGAISAALPALPRDMLQPAYVTAIAGNPAHPVNAALRANDVYDWRPLAPVRLYHGKADKDVAFKNSEVAYARMSALGADVRLINVGDTLDHATATLPCLIAARAWFDALRTH
jgi:hypothetical protein